MKARVIVRIKPEVSDPQGMAIREALASQDYGAVRKVRVGKVFDLELEEADPARAREAVEKIARDILANPIVEEFACDIGGETSP